MIVSCFRRVCGAPWRLQLPPSGDANLEHHVRNETKRLPIVLNRSCVETLVLVVDPEADHNEKADTLAGS